MKNIFWLILLVLLFLSCEKLDELKFESMIGEYVELDSSENYFHLELRDDSTYYFNHAINHSCEIWGHYYGAWKLDGNKIILTEGIDLDSMITVRGKRNEKGDTLIIFFEEKLLETYPNLTVNFGHDEIDYKPVNNQILLNKNSFLTRNEFLDIFEKDENGKIIYDYFPLEIYLRSGIFYKKINRFLDYEKLELGLKKIKTDLPMSKILLEYKSKNGVLISAGKDEWIYKHQLIPGER
ncbi:MAG: hypothetical protein AB8H03_22615 [Saprospiraceae bacterium]